MKTFIKLITIFGVILMVWFFYNYEDKKENPDGNSLTTEKQTTKSPEEKASDLGHKISKKAYYNYETRYGTSISFSHWGNTNHGSCTFQEGNILHGGECRFMYSYIISDGQINAKFSRCDCEGRITNDRVFYYDESRDVVTTLVNGETFEFAPEGSPYLKKGRRSMESISQSAREPESAVNESGYSTGSDGKVYENADCSLCGGTGIEKSTNSMGGDRICPQCEGTGHQHY